MIICRFLGIMSLARPYEVINLTSYCYPKEPKEGGLLGTKVIIRGEYGTYLGSSRLYINLTEFC
jgi:hypothetical protein